jgi:tripartite-type tricarboxylate transporter receptor subunit TctC
MQAAHTKRMLLGAVAIVLAVTGNGASAADTYPNQTVHIVVPFPPGGTTDLIARQYSEYLTRDFGQSVIIDNRPGAATNIGAESVARSKPDGLTLLFGGVNQTINPAMGPFPPFDLFGSLEPVSLVAKVPYILAANPSVPFSNPKELLAAAKAEPGKLTVSSAQLDVYIELLKARAGINLLHVPYKGGAPATADAISGQVNMVFAQVPVLIPQIQGGKLKAIAVTSPKRIASLPNTATLVESGIDYDISGWYGILVPVGTPKAIIERLQGATRKIAATPEFIEKLRLGGATAEASRPAEFKRQLQDELVFWSQIAKAMPGLVNSNK